LFATKNVFIGKAPGDKEVPKDKFGNKNLNNYGLIEQDLPWYVDTESIPSNKLSRLIFAYNHGILTEANPENPVTPIELDIEDHDFKVKDNGDRIFVGKNYEMYQKLQNNNFDVLRKFINSTPKNESGKQNLIDLFDYERKGYNPLSRPRFEVLELIKTKLKEFGPGISGIRINED
jgi:uncharacterized protein YeeX (DUF496 family)